MGDYLDHLAGPIDVDYVDGEAHEGGVNGTAGIKHQRLLFPKGGTSQQPNETRHETAGALRLTRQLRASGGVADAHGPRVYLPGKSLMIVITAGPRITMNSVGKMHSTNGKIILTGAL
jgi:hypothetical protein